MVRAFGVLTLIFFEGGNAAFAQTSEVSPTEPPNTTPAEGQADAPSTSLAIIGLNALDGDDELANTLTSGLRTASSETSAPSAIDVALSQLELVHGCDATEDDCAQTIGAALNVTRWISGSLTRVSDGVFSVELFVFEVGSRARRQRTFIYHSEENALVWAQRAIARLTGRWGRAVLVGVQASASVAVDGQTPEESDVQATGDTITIELPVGHHQFVVTNASGRESEFQVDIATDEDTRTTVSFPEPARVNEDTPWLPIALIGGGALLVGGGITFGVLAQNLGQDANYRTYQAAVPRGSDVCAEARASQTFGAGADLPGVRSTCGQADTFEILQYVLWGVGLGSAATGGVLLLDTYVLSPSEESEHVRATLRPYVGPETQGLSIHVEL